MATDQNPNTYENQFWLQILGDQARFILLSLSPDERVEVADARKFIALLDSLLAKSREQLTGNQLKELNNQAFSAVQDYRQFILHILDRQLTGEININFLPSVINHVITDTEAYLSILDLIKQNKALLLDPIDIHIQWLLDSSVYALNVSDNVGIIYRDIRKQAEDFSNSFLDLYIRALEMKGFLRTGLTVFRAVIKLNQDVLDLTRRFAEFILELHDNVSNKQVTGTLTPLYLDHLYRIICYYLTSLSKIGNIKPPICDPTAPRRE